MNENEFLPRFWRQYCTLCNLGRLWGPLANFITAALEGGGHWSSMSHLLNILDVQHSLTRELIAPLKTWIDYSSKIYICYYVSRHKRVVTHVTTHLYQCEHVCAFCVQLCMSKYYKCSVFVLYVFIINPPLQNFTFMDILVKIYEAYEDFLLRYFMYVSLLSDWYCTMMYYSIPHSVR